MDSYKIYSDEELVELLKGNDEAAFTEIYNRYWHKLLAVAFHRSGNMSDAKEIIQTIFVALWNRKAKLDIRYSLATYLSTAVKYEIINVLSAIKRRQKITNSFQSPEVSQLTNDADLDYKKLQELVHQLVNKLPEKCKVIYQLSRDQGLKNKEIAQVLNISEKTVENQLTIALRKLKSDLSGPALIIFCSFWG